jgi:AcrR family transcriptional regulator
MGNREDLLAGAKRCLPEKGYERTTVRDIASAAGVSMAAIGYHHGSREALLNAAMSQAMEDWGVAMAETLDPAASPRERYASEWTAIIGSFARDRELWLATFEPFLVSERSPELRKRLATGRLGARPDRGRAARPGGRGPRADVAHAGRDAAGADHRRHGAAPHEPGDGAVERGGPRRPARPRAAGRTGRTRGRRRAIELVALKTMP